MIRLLLVCDAERCLETRREYVTAEWVVRLRAEESGWRCAEESDLCPEHAREAPQDEHD